MPKLPECQICQFNARSQYLVCAIHPNGCKDDQCIDFRLDSSIQVEPSWSPDGYEFYDGELINSSRNLTQSDRLNLLETHPLFTGHCPKCGYEFEETPLVHWDCPSCQWKDDSV